MAVHFVVTGSVSVTVASRAVALPSVPDLSAPASTTGAGLVRVSVMLSATGGFVPSLPVKVRVQVPAVVQDTDVSTALALAKVQVAARGHSAPAVAVHFVVSGSVSVTVPSSTISARLAPVLLAPASTVGGGLRRVVTRIVTVRGTAPSPLLSAASSVTLKSPGGGRASTRSCRSRDCPECG